ncbi:MAG: hypothetical protein HQK54_13755 [Oligoflexales bacterium]|nr:hypothetical protein [Oligoflexales bacterium]
MRTFIVVLFSIVLASVSYANDKGVTFKCGESKELDSFIMWQAAGTAEYELKKAIYGITKEFVREITIEKEGYGIYSRSKVPAEMADSIWIVRARGSFFTNTFSIGVLSPVVLVGVTCENASKKFMEALPILVQEIKEKREFALKNIDIEMATTPTVSSPADSVFNAPTIDMRMGTSTPYFKTWVQLPAVLNEGGGQIYWLRTVVGLDGLAAEKGGREGFFVGRVSATIWEIRNDPDFVKPWDQSGKALQVGTVNYAVRVDEATNAKQRLDLDIIGFNYNLSDWNIEKIRLFSSFGLSVGLRMIEQDQAVSQLLYKYRFRMGIAINGKVYVMGTLDSEVASENDRFVTSGAEIGYFFTRNLILKAGVSYSAHNHGNRDVFYIVPEGWSFFGGMTWLARGTETGY